MWPRDYQARLLSWNHLRQRCRDRDLQPSLAEINTWWFSCPWMAYSLHWDDRADWPDPWQLLAENRLCGLARGLGILYTITMLERDDLQNTVLIETSNDNLVLVTGKKYILNWTADRIVNINPGTKNPRHQLTQQEAQQKIN